MQKKRLATSLLLASLTLAALPGSASAQGALRFTSPEAAFEQGLGAYKAGLYALAVPALSYAAERKVFLAQYFLAQLYADNQSAMTDHSKAYQLYHRIVEELASSIDVDDDERAPYVGRALTALARYVYRGLPEIGLAPNATRAAEYLEEAATFFRDLDAQFELAKLYLKGDGVPEDRKRALHWLSTLTQEGHVGAQAFLADLLWTGKIVPRDEKRALALITLATENAPAHERIWIEDIYHRIFCGSVAGVRQEADTLVLSYRRLYVPRASHELSIGPAAPDVSPARSCSSGELLPRLQPKGRRAAATGPAAPSGGAPAKDAILGVRGQQ
jgi:hypothetical protein